MWRRTLLLLVVACVALLAMSCRPDYPKCNTDEHCSDSEEGQADGRLYCVNGLCQQCREDADCGDPSLECNAGVCDRIPGYCTSVDDCPGNQQCRDNRCGPECMDDTECGDGQQCKGGSCVAEDECSTDADCADGQSCENGTCVAAAACSLDNILFEYDSSNLSDSARSTLQANAECIQERNLSVRIEGHADERGNNEYNIALGERRARAVYNYLKNLGVAAGSMDTISYGEERLAQECGEEGADSCHRQNRRVVIEQR